MKRWMLALLFLALLTGACGPVAAPAPVAAAVEPPAPPVTAEGTLLPAQHVELAFAQAGLVAHVSAQPGDPAVSGAVLAELVGLETAQAELAAAELEQTLAQQAVDTAQRNALRASADAHQALLAAQKAYEAEARGWQPGAEDEATDWELALERYVDAEAEYRDAKMARDRAAGQDADSPKRQDAQRALEEAEADLARRYADLLGRLPAPEDRLSEAQAELLQAISALELARQQLDRLDQGVDREQSAAAGARLEAAKARVAAAQAALSFFTVRAPFAGTVLSVRNLAAGEAAVPGQPVIYLADTARWVVETTDLAEIDIARVATGQRAVVELDAFPEEQFSGTVTAVDPVGREYLGDMTYQITVTLDEADARFLWNMTATVTVAIE